MPHFVFFDEPRETVARRTRMRAAIAATRMRIALIRLVLLAAKHNFNPAQPRAPAGEPDGGRWTLVAGGPYVPTGTARGPNDGSDSLDPKRLNKPMSELEQQQLAQAFTRVKNGNVAGMDPHVYDNYPHRDTGAQLPPSTGGYTVYDVGSRLGWRRLVIDNATGAAYYTQNHYESFWAIVVQ